MQIGIGMGIGRGGGATPNSLLSNLVSIWKLDEASGTRVDSIGGLSLSEGSATLVAPVLGIDGQNAGWFSNPGTGSFLKRVGDATALSASGSFSIHALVSVDSTAAWRIVSKNGGNTTNGQEYELLFDNSTGSFAFRIYHDRGTSNDIIRPVAAQFPGQLYQLVAWFDKATGELGISVNGVEATKTSAAVPVATTCPFNLGAYNSAHSVAQPGMIQHVYFWNKALSSTERARLYNSGKYLLYPFTESIQTNRLIVFDGDSFTAARLYPQQLCGLLGRIQTSYDVSVSGQKSDQILDNKETRVYPLYNAAYAKNIVCVIIGTNDCAIARAPATTHTYLQQYCQGVRSQGFKVIVATIPNSTYAGYPNFNTDRLALNALIQANYSTYADGLADIGANATIGADAAPNDPKLFLSTDKIHPVVNATAIMANLFKAAIDAIP